MIHIRLNGIMSPCVTLTVYRRFMSTKAWLFSCYSSSHTMLQHTDHHRDATSSKPARSVGPTNLQLTGYSEDFISLLSTSLAQQAQHSNT
jgi:hypothetical protein